MKQFPDAKFIISHRDEASWAESMKWQYTTRPEGVIKATGVLATGIGVYHEQFHREMFRFHYKALDDYLPSRRRVDINVFAGDGWARLCHGLNLAIPDEPFPHELSRDG